MIVGNGADKTGMTEERRFATGFITKNKDKIKQICGIGNGSTISIEGATFVIKNWLEKNKDMLNSQFKTWEALEKDEKIQSQIMEQLKNSKSAVKVKSLIGKEKTAKIVEAIDKLKVGESLKLPEGIVITKTKGRE